MFNIILSVVLSTVGWRLNLVNTDQPMLGSEGFLEVFQVEGLVANLSIADTIETAGTTCKVIEMSVGHTGECHACYLPRSVYTSPNL